MRDRFIVTPERTATEQTDNTDTEQMVIWFLIRLIREIRDKLLFVVIMRTHTAGGDGFFDDLAGEIAGQRVVV